MSSHDTNRSKVCAIFWRKGSNNISSRKLELLRAFVYQNFDMNDRNLPCGICSTCNTVLSCLGRGDFSRKLPISDTFNARLSLRLGRGGSCRCAICKVAHTKMRNHRKLDLPAPVPRRPARLCKSCLSPIYRGRNHSKIHCRDRKALVNNVVNFSRDRNVKL